ncbi:hypothetical protein [Mesorhizobium sp. BR-1-1-10]|uniref:hypothetical protein n=1 Tax=Mesorhizobium sp. BR-1-1-10 TaxID=2876660 RepID=UPI001CD08259|nr:hypothetical protein [Mesorhizobium sp. BR-1-1-10]MBZ9975584.1 hypothetical protein [Mesorhizobium sp. BR-1-1-10]
MISGYERKMERYISIAIGLTIITLALAFLTFIAVIVAYDTFYQDYYLSPSHTLSAQSGATGFWVFTSTVWAVAGQLVVKTPTFFSSLITWPIVTLISVVALLSERGRAFISQFANRAKRIKLSQLEIELSEEGARKLSTSAKMAFLEFRSQADAEFGRQVRIKRIRHALESTLAETTIPTSDGPKPVLEATNARCTIHVPDILFSDNLLQLIDYYPDGGGAMRRFSIRYGALGRAWRLEEDFEKGLATEISQYELIEVWGMTKEESQKISRHRPSYVCVVMRGESRQPIGILYLDSRDKQAFGSDAEARALCGRLHESAKRNGLSKALEEITNELNRYATNIDIQIQQ